MSTAARSVKLFLFLTVAGGASGFVGSVFGGAFGQRGLFIGGFTGGLIGSAAAALLAKRFNWIRASDGRATAVGAALGFAAAALITVNTLSTPVGALLSPLLIGVGGLVGRAYARRA